MGLGDWIANMKIRHIKKPYGRVHRGFFKGFSIVQDEIYAAMTRGRYYKKKVYLGGHSLGGALALLAATNSTYELGTLPIVGIFTYGMPKTSNREAVQFMNQVFGAKHTRFVNNRDAVTRLPPGSRHAGRLLHFTESGELHDLSDQEGILDNPNLVEEFTKAEFAEIKLKLSSGDEGFIPGVRDHSIGEYIKKIRKFTQIEND